MGVIVRTLNLTKQFGSIRAVDRVSLEVERGEIYGFLGLNGAGKTTTIRMLLGMIRPTSGEAEVLGYGIRPCSVQPWSSVGFLVETPHSYPELTVRENLELVYRLRRLSEATSIDSIIERLGLAPYADRRAGTLSLGNSQRLGLAKALFHNPELLILDEPANGLDPAGIVEVRELLRDLALNRGVTVFISSHLLSEISKIASRIGIIHNGALLVERSAADLSKDRRSRLLVNTRDQVAALSLLGNIVEPRITESGEIEILNSTATQNPDEIARLLVQGGHPPTLLKVEEEDLESYFLRLVGMAKGGTQ